MAATVTVFKVEPTGRDSSTISAYRLAASKGSTTSQSVNRKISHADFTRMSTIESRSNPRLQKDSKFSHADGSQRDEPGPRVSEVKLDEPNFQRASNYRKVSRMERILDVSRRLSQWKPPSHRASNHTLTGSTSNPGSTSLIFYENSYDLGPSDELKFNITKAESMMLQVLTSMLSGETYEYNLCRKLALTISDTLKDRLKELAGPRYKYICDVTLGQSSGQGLQIASRCLWAADTDRAASVEYSNGNLIAVVTAFAVYLE